MASLAERGIKPPENKIKEPVFPLKQIAQLVKAVGNLIHRDTDLTAYNIEFGIKDPPIEPKDPITFGQSGGVIKK